MGQRGERSLRPAAALSWGPRPPWKAEANDQASRADTLTVWGSARLGERGLLRRIVRGDDCVSKNFKRAQTLPIALGNGATSLGLTVALRDSTRVHSVYRSGQWVRRSLGSANAPRGPGRLGVAPTGGTQNRWPGAARREGAAARSAGVSMREGEGWRFQLRAFRLGTCFEALELDRWGGEGELTGLQRARRGRRQRLPWLLRGWHFFVCTVHLNPLGVSLKCIRFSGFWGGAWQSALLTSSQMLLLLLHGPHLHDRPCRRTFCPKVWKP